MANLSKVMCGLTIRPRCPLRRFRGDWCPRRSALRSTNHGL